MNYLPALLLALCLAACGTAPTTVTNSAPSTTVTVGVKGKCVEAKDIPPKPTTSMPLGGDIKQKAAGAAADLEALDIEYDRLVALLQECIVSGGRDAR